ncbi:MAG TPA: ricin-type beta-trefoil lectin domain protein [Streptosporangiaceae bacterium]
MGRCLDVAGAGTADGTQVRMWDCNGTVAQQWQWNGALVNPHSGKCLDTPGDAGAGGPSLVIATCNRHAAQSWVLPLSNRDVALGTGKALLSNPQVPAGTQGIAGGTAPAIAVDVIGQLVRLGGTETVAAPGCNSSRGLVSR